MDLRDYAARDGSRSRNARSRSARCRPRRPRTPPGVRSPRSIRRSGHGRPACSSPRSTQATKAPLAGVPFAMKEVAPHLKGQVSQLGSRWASGGLTGAADTHLGQRIRAAGLRVIARTRAPEFAFNATTEPVAHGPTRNPWDLERSVGGSSGGAAALVAARALPLAHATDGGGSIRIPASLCGIVGLKPTRSRIPVGPGLWEGLHGMAHDFVLCRTLRDAAAALDALHGPGAGDKYVIPPPARPYAEDVGADPGRLRVRWTADAWSGAPVAPECRAAVETTAGRWTGSATTSRRARRQSIPTCFTARSSRCGRRASPSGRPRSSALSARLRSPKRSRPARLAMLRHGASLSAVELLDGYGDCNAIGRAIGKFFENADVLLLPSVARTPWKLGELDQNDESLDADAWVRKLFSRLRAVHRDVQHHRSAGDQLAARLERRGSSRRRAARRALRGRVDAAPPRRPARADLPLGRTHPADSPSAEAPASSASGP